MANIDRTIRLTPVRAQTLRFIYHHAQRFGTAPGRTALALFFGSTHTAIGQRLIKLRAMGMVAFPNQHPEQLTLTGEARHWIRTNGEAAEPDWRRAYTGSLPDGTDPEKATAVQPPVTTRAAPVEVSTDHGRARFQALPAAPDYVKVRNMSRDVLMAAVRLGDPDLSAMCANLFSLLHG